MANGHAWDEILAWYPDLDADDLKAVLLYAAEFVQEFTIPLKRA